jgi:hypothetical protein
MQMADAEVLLHDISEFINREKGNMPESLTPEAKPVIAYVAGYPRSGSTLVDRALGSSDKVTGLGELVLAFDHLLDPEGKCACLQTFRDCPLWGKFLRQLGPSLSNSSQLAKWESIRYKLEGKSGLFRLLLGKFSEQECKDYLDYVDTFMGAVEDACESGRRVIVDSSKSGYDSRWRPVILSRLAGREVRMIHLVRDVRGVMWSHFSGSNTLMEKGVIGAGTPFITILLDWLRVNVLVSLAVFLLPKGHFLYSDYGKLVSNPKKEFSRIAMFLDLDPHLATMYMQGTEVRGGGHQVYGNRMRYEQVIHIREDSKWKHHLPTQHKILGWLVMKTWKAWLSVLRLFGASIA